MNPARAHFQVGGAALAAAYIRACELELQAVKPGNVHVHAMGHGMDAEDFRRSANASAPVLTDREPSLGKRIYRAVAATGAACGCNTNLGIVLLAAPLLLAAQDASTAEELRGSLEHVLHQADVADSEWINRAIRLAAPGGLGDAARHDVRQPASAAVRDIMREASQRDMIARQYANDYADLYEFAAPHWRQLRSRWRSDEWATTGLYLGLLARFPDSHVARKHGAERARNLSAKAADWELALLQSAVPGESYEELMAVDRELKEATMNPGTTADMTVASVLIVMIEELLSGQS